MIPAHFDRGEVRLRFSRRMFQPFVSLGPFQLHLRFPTFDISQDGTFAPPKRVLVQCSEPGAEVVAIDGIVDHPDDFCATEPGGGYHATEASRRATSGKFPKAIAHSGFRIDACLMILDHRRLR